MTILKGRKVSYLIAALIELAVISDSLATIPDISAFEKNMKAKGSQTALVGKINSLIISRPNVDFCLGPGDVTLFDFGASRPCAMVFEGKGIFRYNPPDDVERGQLIKFTDRDKIENSFEKLVMFFTVDKPYSEITLPLLPFKPKKIIFNTYDAVLCRVD